MYGNLEPIKNDCEIFEMLVTQHEFERAEIEIIMEPTMKECLDLIR